MVRHPLIDAIEDQALVVGSVAPVMWLSDSMRTLLERARAAHRAVVLRTPATTALTPALRHALGTSGGAWAVEGVDGALRDGRTGVPARDVAELLDRAADLVATPAPDHPVAAESVTQIGIDLTMRHDPDRVVDVGGAVEALCEAAGSCPERWGTAEPLSVPWDRWIATQYAKHVAPGVSTSFAVGAGVSATMTAHMADDIVVETVSAVITAPPDGVERVLDAVRAVADSVVPVFGVVMRRFGAVDHLVRAESHGEPVPAAVVVGPEATSLLDRSGSWPPPGTRVEPFGGPDSDGLLVRLDGGWDALETFLDRVDEERFADLVGGAPLETAVEDGLLDDVGPAHDPRDPHHRDRYHATEREPRRAP
ncbi:DUF6177 family protein [Curtobacterium ammoniigenes]|uniref:DUF6177 family protein n=1 Tax=Curtobacterium ammoniigenes TaxID=395387 RepID=UPI00082E5788|nr:DUF6177 family protein [Curtobacterium ammoniigenes]